MSLLTDEQIRAVLPIVAKWLDVGYPEKRPTNADAWHSALLQRMLSGKDPLPKPPPLAFSYPWYELIENGHAEGYFDLSIWPDGLPRSEDKQPVALICQSRWLIVGKGEGGLTVEHPSTGLLAYLEPNGREGKLMLVGRPEDA